MSEKEGKNKKRILDQESWDLWYELEEFEHSVDSWCCQVVKKGNFEEEILRKLNATIRTGVLPLRVNFCLQCGKPLIDVSEIVINCEESCCKLLASFEFAEIFDPITADVHRLKGNFCFNCGKEIDDISSRN